MVAGCGNKCVKYFFWFLNFLFFVLGAVILGLSIWMKVDPASLGRIASTARIDLSRLPLDTINIILYGCIVIGALLLILGFLGCCGSACESLIVIGLYFIFVIIIFVIKIVAVVLYFIKKDQVRDYMMGILRTEIVQYYNRQQSAHDLMDSLQQGLQCCGSYGCNDYTVFGMLPPATCPLCQYNPPGCGLRVWTAIESNLLIVIVIVFAILVVELFALILSCVMCGAVKDKRNQSY